MVIETYSDKEVAVGTCEMAPEMFADACKIAKDLLEERLLKLPRKSRTSLMESMEAIGWQLLVSAMDSSLLIKQQTSPISSLEKPSRLSYSKTLKDRNLKATSINSDL